MKKLLILFLVSAFLSCDNLINNMSGNGYTTENYYGEWEGDSYTGEFKDGLRHGLGTYTYSSGDVYVGEWIEGEMHEQDHFIIKTEMFILVILKMTKKPEMGHTISMMAKFILDLLKREKTGMGSYYWPNGNEYVGEWNNDSMMEWGSCIMLTGIYGQVNLKMMTKMEKA